MSCPEELRSLEAFWHMKRGARALPSRNDFTPQDLRPWLGNLAIITVERATHDLRFRVVLSGTQLDNYRGHGITGRYVDEICCSIEDTTPYYRDCVTRGVPVHYRHDNSPNSAIYTDMGKMLLPLSENGFTVDRILAAMYPLRADNGNTPACRTAA